MSVSLEAPLVSLLNRVYDDSWSLLIFQTLIWSFRRWAIHYLMSSEASDTMKDYIWDTHLDLVRQFAPVELKDFGIIWLNPSNIGNRTDSLEELNRYFLQIVDALDNAIQTDNEDAQAELATFLDETITVHIDTWLKDKSQYRIYPTADESPDSFSPARIFEIMKLIVDDPSTTPVIKAPEPPAPPVETVKSAFVRKQMTRKASSHEVPKTRKRRPAHLSE